MTLDIKGIELIDEKELREVFKEIIRQMNGEVDKSGDRIYLRFVA